MHESLLQSFLRLIAELLEIGRASGKPSMPKIVLSGVVAVIIIVAAISKIIEDTGSVLGLVPALILIAAIGIAFWFVRHVFLGVTRTESQGGAQQPNAGYRPDKFDIDGAGGGDGESR